MPLKDPEARKAYARARYQATRAAIRAQQAAYWAANKTELNAKNRQRHHADKDRRNANRRQYHAEHLEEDNARTRVYHHANRDTRLEQKRTYHQENKARVNAKRRVYYREHWEQEQQAHKAFFQAHPGYMSAFAQKRRAQRLGAPRNNLTRAQWQAIKEHYGHRCVYCGKKSQRLTMDHITPLSRGGSHTVSNIVPACQSCNSKKHAGPPLTPIQPLLLVAEEDDK